MAKSTIELTAVDKTAAAFKSVEAGLGKLNAQLGGLLGPLTALTTAGGGFAAFTELLGKSIDKAMEAERVNNKLDAVLRAVGESAGATKQRISALADDLARVTRFDDDKLKEGMTLLLTFPNIASVNFARATRAATDLAVLLGGDLENAITTVGKALSDPVEGLGALNRAGIRFNETQRRTIQELYDTGRTADAQDIILERLESRLGGTAAGENRGLTGAARSVTKEWDEFLKTIGRTSAVSDSTAGGLNVISGILEKINKSLKESQQASLNQLFSGLSRGDRIKLGIEVDPMLTPDGIAKLQKSLKDLGGPKVHILSEDEIARIDAAGAKFQQLMGGLKKDSARAEADITQDQYAAIKIRIDAAQEEWRAKADAAHLSVEQRKQFEEELAQYLANKTQQELAGNEEKRNREQQQIFDGYVSLRSSLDDKFAAEEEFRTSMLELNRAYREGMIQDDIAYDKMREAIEAQHQARLGGALAQANASRSKLWRAAWGGDLSAMAGVTQEMSQLMTSKSRTMFNIGKAAALANASISMYSSIASALETKPFFPLGLAMAATATAYGFSNIAKIRSVEFGAGDGAGGGAAAPTFNADPGTGLPAGVTALPQIDSLNKQQPPARRVDIHLNGARLLSDNDIRDHLIPALKEAIGDGVDFGVK